ncbi:filamentous hemagglutinin family N-terminal domain-containing protein [Duganella sp. CF402]|uniref:YDG domain-containing protein n=1 Tax=unclassified Duganella TaxID=2636909 RepID=UPI0008D6032E|nr:MULTISPECIES: YDG domain-containing protein [unclassified Duganella]RZT09227.1 filamentous hemagglutinin family protein [Duganella sp. BK701]SEL65627.1 filamentous hemagglutinin family N-terminal domain-containing protein [Duganella sp. CF402]
MNASARSRKLRRKAIAVLIAACYSSVYAAPVSPTVVAGQASFNLQGKTYTITNTPNAIINWQGFSIAADELTRFVQQSSDSKVLNRVTGQDPSLILGSLQSNGKVFLINPNGVMFGAGSRVDVNGLVASSLNISNADFLAGKNNFNGAANAGKVSNQGAITTPSGGQIFLIAPAVENSGIISSPNGEVVLAAGHTVQLFDSADPNVQVVVSSPADQALNLGQVVAQGGRIGVYGALVNQRGSINANSAVRGANGKIVLKASGTMLAEAGSQTTATGSNLNTGGEILLLGEKVGLSGNALVDASGAAGGGTVLVGGDYQGKNAAVTNAQQAYVGKEAVIRADAVDSGNGGKVVVWSDAATQVFGAISARGGTAGGHGGMVETSGHYLDMQGTVDTRAPKGANGSLLLDPSDVYIALDPSTALSAGMEIGATIPLSGGVFLETTAVKDSLLLTGVLQTALLTSDVTVSTANSSGSGTGVISVLSPLLWVTSRNLSLQADSNIQIKSSITGINGALNLTAGGAIVQTTSPIDALAVSSLGAIAAGSITLDNNANTIGASAALASSGGSATLTAVNVNLAASSAAGALTVTAYNGDLSVNGDLSAGTGITLQSSKASGTLTIASGQAVNATAGDIKLVADKMSLLGSASVNTGHALWLRPYQDSVNVLIGGSAADATGTLGLSQAELQRMSVASNALLAIGTSFSDSGASGTLTVNGALDLSSMGGGLLLQSQAGDLSISSGAALTVPGVISLQTLPTGNHRVTNAGTVTSSSGINVYAGKMTLAAGTLNASSVGLESGNDIALGATSAGSDTLALTSGDLNSANATQLHVSVNSSHGGTGDITVSAPLSLSVPSLSLTAQRNIALDAALTTSGSLGLSAPGAISADGAVAVGGSFELVSGDWTQNSASLPAFSAGDFKLSGGTFVRVQGGDGSLSTPYQLADIYGLQGAATLGGATSYVLSNNIDASATGSWSGSFVPLASSGYTGVFDGAGHTISGLSIDRASESNVGLFARIDTGTVRDLTLSDVYVNGRYNVGGLAGLVSEGIGYINNVSVSGTVAGIGNAGLLIGRNGGLVGNVHSSGTVYGDSGTDASNIGGLVGANSGQISDAWSDATVSTSGFGYAGGLVGSNYVGADSTGAIVRSYALGTVYSSGEIVGGLVGDNNGGALSLSYASGSVSGGRNVGGLAGRNTNGGTIYNVFASGEVSVNTDNPYLSHANIGGLVGELFSGYVSSVYSTGHVDDSGVAYTGGLVGKLMGGSLSSGYFNQDSAGTSTDGAGGVGLTAAQMLRQSSFAGFNFDDGPEWRIYDGHTAPMLKTFLIPYEVGVTGGGSISKVYDGESATFTGSTGTLPAAIHGALGFDGAVNAGSYTVGGLWSTSYDISYTGSSATLTIDPRPVTAVVSASKTYDGSTSFSGTPSVAFTNLVGSDTLGLAGVIHFDNKNAGSGKVLSFGDVGLTDNPLGNYVLSSGGVSGTGTISPAPLAVSGLTVNSRTYDGSLAATLAGTPGATPLSGDTVTVSLVGSGTASFADKNVGSGKAVTVSASSFTLGGADGGNYVALAPTGLTGEITPALLGLSGMTAASRVYNLDYDSASGTYGQLATVSGGTLVGVVSGDNVVIASAKGLFSDKNVGTAKPVALASLVLGGADAGNYEMGPPPLDMTANITPATISVSLASRAYNNSTAASFSGATLHGVLSGAESDVVSLSVGETTSGAYADKNVGSAKLVTVSGGALGLSGADAGNYVLSPTVTGDITARALATWTATSAGLWSDAANWADGVAPSASNVLAASLGSSAGLVTYDSSAGTTSLVTLSSSGTSLTLTGGKLSLTGSEYDASYLSGVVTNSGGTLEVLGKLSASNLVLASGTLSGVGSGSYIYVNNLSQTGGIIDSTGTVYLGSGGNITTGNIRAHSLTLNAGEGGVVTQTSGSQLVADTLSVTSSGNITLANANNHVGAFDATIYGSGNIVLTNVVTSGELALGPLTTTGNIVIDNTGAVHTVGAITAHTGGAGTGVISITAHSPVMIDSTLAGADIGLSASTDIVLGSGSALSSSHSIDMTAGTGITLGGSLSVPAGGSISAVAKTGSISASAGTHISSGGSPVTLSAPMGSVSTSGTSFGAGTVPVISDGAAAAAAAAAAEAAAKAAAEAAAKAAADAAAAAAAAAAADAAAKAAADAAAKAAADAAAKAAADAAAADAAAKAAADAAAAQAAAEAAAKAAADAAAKAAADAAAKAAADAAAKAAADAAAKAAADAAAQSQQNQPVTAAINSTVNIINSSVNASQNKASTPATVPEQHVASSATTGSSSGGSALEDKVADEKNADGSAKTTTTAAKEQVKKMYCN